MLTGVAQRKRAGLITLRSLVQTQSSVLLQFRRGAEPPSNPHHCAEGFEGALDAPSSVALQKLSGRGSSPPPHYEPVWCNSATRGSSWVPNCKINACYRYHFTSPALQKQGGRSPLKPPLRKGGVRGTLGSLLSRCSSEEERLNPRPSPLSTRATAMV